MIYKSFSNLCNIYTKNTNTQSSAASSDIVMFKYSGLRQYRALQFYEAIPKESALHKQCAFIKLTLRVYEISAPGIHTPA